MIDLRTIYAAEVVVAWLAFQGSWFVSESWLDLGVVL